MLGTYTEGGYVWVAPNVKIPAEIQLLVDQGLEVMEMEKTAKERKAEILDRLKSYAMEHDLRTIPGTKAIFKVSPHSTSDVNILDVVEALEDRGVKGTEFWEFFSPKKTDVRNYLGEDLWSKIATTVTDSFGRGTFVSRE